MKAPYILVSFLLGIWLLASSCEPSRLRYNFDWARVQTGDSTEWKALTYDDSHWEYYYVFEEEEEECRRAWLKQCGVLESCFAELATSSRNFVTA